MNKRITATLLVNFRGQVNEVTRKGTLTGEVSEAGMLRVEWDIDGYGRMGWIEPGTFTEV
ncbi:hypothetical protein SEA_EDEN_55 [Microbacterium phage Eden]|uniref:Uncharacterized protein n=1 Tax=Microbacterium phage Eden TaxID=2250289 RepID=A0A345KWE8_9CAUD|nr:hypothetical protein HOT71_gp55 [Microbacterium phage Eden]AXH47350.1 hypothetical protein SEA_EDEN_55 [Microbacterium phage Eden]